ncbi:MAG: tetratricopeptide repeat protein [Spirulina sp. SIO3F2]|nr:tetratricopeptide repeat protein [Spirulina sp. SIO3F2]
MRLAMKVLGGLSVLLVWGQASDGMAQTTQVIEGEITTEESYFLDQDGSYYNVHWLEGQAGEQVVITLESRAFDAYLIVADEEGNKITEDNDSGGGTNARVVVTVPANGIYGVLANTAQGGETGAYRLSLEVMQGTGTDHQATDSDEAYRLFEQGRQQYQTSQFNAASQSWQQALTLYRQIGNRQGESASLGSLGRVYDALGQYQRAIDLHEQALDIARDIGNRQGEAASLGNLGGAYDALGQYQRAIALYEQALDITRDIGDRQGEASSLVNLGRVYDAFGQYQRAIAFYEQALDIARDIGNRQGEAVSLGNLGRVYDAFGQYQRAITFYEQALDIARDIGDRQRTAASLGNLGSTYFSLGQYQQALTLHEQSLVIDREIGNRQGEAASLESLGRVYFSLGQYPQAIAFYEQALDIKREIGDRQGTAVSLGSLGSAYFSLGQYQQAIALHEQALDITHDIGNRQGTAASLGNLGRAYDALGQYQRAIALHEQSLVIDREIGDRQGEAISLGNLGGVYNALGQHQQAIALHEQALDIARDIGNRQRIATSLGNLGNAYFSLRQYQRAIAFHEQFLDIAREMGDRQGEAASLDNLGIAYFSLGQYQRAIAFHEQSLDIAREMGDQQGEGDSLNNLGAALQNLDRYSKAEQQLLAAAQVYESIRADLGGNDTNKVSIFEQQSRTYRALQQVQIAQNKTIAALETAERGRARAFVELLVSRLNTDNSKVNITPPNLAQIQQVAKAQNATLIEYSVVYDDFDLDDKPGQESIQESALYIWVIPPNGNISFRQVDLTPLWRNDDLSLEDLVQFTRDSLGVRGLDLRNLNRLVAVRPRDPQKQKLTDDDQLLRKLHSLLIEPITDLLPQNPEDRVIFIPQSSLFLVPFPALKNATGEYLIQNHTILTAPSIQTLSLTRTQKQQSPLGNGALIVGNPTMPSIAPDFGETPQPLTPLPGAEQEAKAIADLLDTNAITGNAAHKSAMVAQMQNAELIHLATHGLLDDIRGIGSAIALAPDPNFNPELGQVNGLLTAEEIFDLNLKADLVVLSACDTGRGRITGDGVVGLSRSFIAAGVPSVLVSLWQVPDAPTAQLMTEFYSQREQTGDNAQALRQAMLATMQSHPEPRNWAAFTLIGEAD